MKKIILLTIISLFFSVQSFAIVNIGLDVPVNASIDGKAEGKVGNVVEASVKSIEGIGLYAVFFGLGLGYDNFMVKQKFTGSGGEFETDLKLYNVFYRINIPILHFDLGALIGNGTYKSGNEEAGEKSATGFLLRAGYNIAPLFSLNLGYKNVSVPSVAALSKHDYHLISLGFDVGF